MGTIEAEKFDMAKELAKLLFNEKNFDALDAYSTAWSNGNVARIYNLLSDRYSLSGLTSPPFNTAPVSKESFKVFWASLRSKIEDMGGPTAASGNFMKLSNTILREVMKEIFQKNSELVL